MVWVQMRPRRALNGSRFIVCRIYISQKSNRSRANGRRRTTLRHFLFKEHARHSGIVYIKNVAHCLFHLTAVMSVKSIKCAFIRGVAVTNFLVDAVARPPAFPLRPCLCLCSFIYEVVTASVSEFEFVRSSAPRCLLLRYW